MKIPLKFAVEESVDDRHQQAKILEQEIKACQRGDWEAKSRLIKIFMPLLLSLAKKRSPENAKINLYVEAGKSGLAHAVKKYSSSIGPERFQIFALDFIEKAMNDSDKPKGFWSRLFGK